jgi:hypothetical protein
MLDAQVDDSVAPERFQTMVLSGLGAAALLIGMLGVYGVLSFVVARPATGDRSAHGTTRDARADLCTDDDRTRDSCSGRDCRGLGRQHRGGPGVASLLYNVKEALRME